MKLAKKILLFIITVLLVLILVFNIYNFISLKIMHKDIASINGYAILEVVSGSMEPTIKIGDMIVIDTKFKDYQKGDIVTFYDVNGAFVTHRIVDINDKEIITKGDNKKNSIDKDPTSIDKIVGKHVFTISGLGILITALKSPVVMAMILLIGIVICIFISTDKDGKPIPLTSEIELEEFLENKEELQKELEIKAQNIQKRKNNKIAREKYKSKKKGLTSKGKTKKKVK